MAKKLVEQKPAFDHEDYNKVVARAELVSIKLADLKYSVKPQIFDKGVRQGLRLSLNVAFDDVRYTPEEANAMTGIECKVTGKHKSKLLVNVRAAYIIWYSGLEQCNAAAVESFVRRVGPFAVYPYFRALCSILDSESGTQLPILPVLKSTKIAGIDDPKNEKNDLTKEKPRPSKKTSTTPKNGSRISE